MKFGKTESELAPGGVSDGPSGLVAFDLQSSPKLKPNFGAIFYRQIYCYAHTL